MTPSITSVSLWNSEPPGMTVTSPHNRPIAGAIDQHTSKVGLLNLGRYEA
jgi:hypothetical protein